MAISDDDKISLPALTALYAEQCAHGRHAETQRATVTTILLAAAGGLVGLMGNLKFSLHCVPAALAVISIGWLGREFIKIYKRKWNESSKRRNSYREKMENIGGFEIPKTDGPKGELGDLWNHAFNGVLVFGLACLLLTIAVWKLRSNNGESLVDQLTNHSSNDAPKASSR